jgi:glucose-6-phosphate 1-epimerase
MITHHTLENGFKYIEVKNSVASAKIALQGAHVFEYKNSENLLWLSETSPFEDGKAIRGGIPLCWPSFGTNNPTLAQHGFARTTAFKLLDIDESKANITKLTLRLLDDDTTLALWNYHFELTLVISIGDTLTLELKTTNKDTKPLTLTQALHTYFDISDIANVSIIGLQNKPYFDALDYKTKFQNGTITFNQEFDCVYQEVDKDILLQDKNRSVQITAQGSFSAVVWNPWIEKSTRMSGMKSNAYKEFVCIETANAYDDFKVLKPEESHTLKVTFTSL